MTKFYVTMTDKFMSGWGEADNKINKLVFECESRQEAHIVADNAEARGDQSYINIRVTKPYYNPRRYYVQVKTKEEYPSWYVERYFTKN
jgi:hypothetical protein